MKCAPVKSSPAHQTDQFAELVCSNSLRAGNIENAVGLLKEEMRRLGSLIMECADATADLPVVPWPLIVICLVKW